jgi:hypothetical protein
MHRSQEWILIWIRAMVVDFVLQDKPRKEIANREKRKVELSTFLNYS